MKFELDGFRPVLYFIFPALVGFPLLFVLQGDYNLTPNTRLIISCIGLILLIVWCIFTIIQRINLGEIRGIRGFFSEKPPKDVVFLLGIYFLGIIPETILNVFEGRYSIIYAFTLNIVIVVNIIIGIKFIRFRDDLANIALVAGCTITGMVIHSFIIYYLNVQM